MKKIQIEKEREVKVFWCASDMILYNQNSEGIIHRNILKYYKINMITEKSPNKQSNPKHRITMLDIALKLIST